MEFIMRPHSKGSIMRCDARDDRIYESLGSARPRHHPCHRGNISDLLMNII